VRLGHCFARERLRIAQTVWQDLKAVKEDRIRVEFMRVTRAISPAYVYRRRNPAAHVCDRSQRASRSPHSKTN